MPGKDCVNIAVYDTKSYDKHYLSKAFAGLKTKEGKPIVLKFIQERLSINTVSLSKGCPAICIFVNDSCDRSIVEKLKEGGISFILLRCAGFNNVDLKACTECGIDVARVPAYSPYAVAEHVLGLLMCLNRKLNLAFNRNRDGNFTLSGLVGRDLNGLTCGVFGTGKIGGIFATIARGVGMKILLWDPFPNQKLADSLGAKYVKDKFEMLAQCDVISLHLPLIKGKTVHFIDKQAIDALKPGAIVLNGSRGPIVDSKALLDSLLSGKLGGAGLDVYEYEQGYFFEDVSHSPIKDPILARLVNMPNVLITSHQAFLTTTALENISETVKQNAEQYFVHGKRGKNLKNTCDLGATPAPKPKAKM